MNSNFIATYAENVLEYSSLYTLQNDIVVYYSGNLFTLFILKHLLRFHFLSVGIFWWRFWTTKRMCQWMFDDIIKLMRMMLLHLHVDMKRSMWLGTTICVHVLCSSGKMMAPKICILQSNNQIDSRENVEKRMMKKIDALLQCHHHLAQFYYSMHKNRHTHTFIYTFIYTFQYALTIQQILLLPT